MSKRSMIGGIATFALCLSLFAFRSVQANPVSRLLADKQKDDKDSKESPVEIKDLPAAVVNALKKAFPEGKLLKADKEIEDGKTVYGVDVKVGEKTIDVDVSEDGKIIKQEEVKAEDAKK